MNRHDSLDPNFRKDTLVRKAAFVRKGTWRQSLEGALAIVVLGGSIAGLAAFGVSGRPLQGTIQLEHFAASLEHVSSIDPATARDLERMLALPYYDCAQVPCSARVQVRNRAVRDRLSALLAMKTRAGTFAAAPGAVTASAVGGIDPR